MSRRNPHATLTPKRALALLLVALDETRDTADRLRRVRDGLAEHVNAALSRKRTREARAA